MSIFDGIKEKIKNTIITRLLDKFKAKNPVIFIVVQAGLTTITITAGAVSLLSEDLIAQIPILTEWFPWLHNVDSWMAITTGATTYLLQILTGSSTKGSTKLVKFLSDHQEGKLLYKAGQRIFLKPKIADQLIEDDIAVEVIITSPLKLPSNAQ